MGGGKTFWVEIVSEFAGKEIKRNKNKIVFKRFSNFMGFLQFYNFSLIRPAGPTSTFHGFSEKISLLTYPTDQKNFAALTIRTPRKISQWFGRWSDCPNLTNNGFWSNIPSYNTSFSLRSLSTAVRMNKKLVQTSSTIFSPGVERLRGNNISLPCR